MKKLLMIVFFVAASASVAGARIPALSGTAPLCNKAADTLDTNFSGLGVDTGTYSDIYSSIKDQASSSFSQYRWAEAEKYYENYFSSVLGGDSKSLNNLRGIIQYGDALHEYALACLFQGKEEQGLELMNLAAECGSSAAKNQTVILNDGAYSRETAEMKGSNKKQFKKYLNEYDFKYSGPTADAEGFWSEMSETNPRLINLRENLNGGKVPQTLQNAIKNIDDSRSLIEDMLNSEMNAPLAGKLENSLRTELLADKKDVIDLRIYENASPNAFATPYGQVYLTDELVDLYSCRAMLLSACAHELTHYLCCHSLVQSWETERKAKQNNIIGSVASGVYAAGASAASMAADRNHPRRHNFIYRDAVNTSIYATSVLIYSSFQAGTNNFRFRYSRNQEIEADLMAYRFCEAMGIGGQVYITALKLLGPDYGKMEADKHDDHPTTAFRVAFLQYIYDQEH